MSRKRKTIEVRLDELESLCSQATASELVQGLQTALSDAHYRLVTKAATIAAEKLLYDLIPSLATAYQRFLIEPLKSDKMCTAKRAIAKALYTLDYDDPDFYLAGLIYQQLEPAWGSSVDSAVELRCTCAFGLVACGDSRAIIALLDLLHDPETQARIGAVRALALCQPSQAEIALRGKVLAGDDEPEVIAECFSALLSILPEESVDFVAGYLDHASSYIQESAALALGESRLDTAFQALQDAWQEILLSMQFRRVLLQAIALLRQDNAYAFLLTVIENDSTQSACEAIEALAIYRHNAKLRASVEAIVTKRNEDGLLDAVRRYWA